MATPEERALAAGARLLTATEGRDVLINTPDGWEVDQPWLWYDGPAVGGGPPVYGNPPPNAAGYARFTTIPAVARCTALVADTLASLAMKILRGRERLPVPDWLTDPQLQRPDERIKNSAALDDVRLSGPEFWSQHLTSLLWKGEGIVYAPLRDARSQPVPGAMWNLNPDDIVVRGGKYIVDGYDWAPSEELDVADLIITRARVKNRRGVGVIHQHFADLGLALDARDYANNMLRRGIPAGYLKVNQPDLTQTAADDLKARWEAAHSGRMRRIAVLNAVTEFHELSIDPQALQLLEMRRYSLLDIALMFGVPAWLLGLPGDSSTYANVESRFIEFAQFTLLTWARRWEAAIDAVLPRGTSMKVNLDSLRRADTATRYAAHKIGIEAGFLDPEEVREMEDLPPSSTALLDRRAMNDRAAQARIEALERVGRGPDVDPLELETRDVARRRMDLARIP
jgi:HK97 family phage portal protein